jgi:hypothetical protein
VFEKRKLIRLAAFLSFLFLIAIRCKKLETRRGDLEVSVVAIKLLELKNGTYNKDNYSFAITSANYNSFLVDVYYKNIYGDIKYSYYIVKHKRNRNRPPFVIAF